MNPMKSKSLLLLFIVTLLIACDVHNDGGTTTIFSFENKSNHTIELFRMNSSNVKDGVSTAPDATLALGEQFEFVVGGWIGSTTTSAFLEVYANNPVIVFDGRYQVSFSDPNLPLNLQEEQTENEKKGWVKYKYTITDADYEYAVEHGDLAILDEWGMTE